MTALNKKRERKLGGKEKSTYIETLVNINIINHYSAIPCNVIIACSVQLRKGDH